MYATWVDLPEFLGVLVSWAVSLMSEAVSRLIWHCLWNVRNLNQVIKLLSHGFLKLFDSSPSLHAEDKAVVSSRRSSGKGFPAPPASELCSEMSFLCLRGWGAVGPLPSLAALRVSGLLVW